jgi:cytochrome c-type biogenesis protein CcmH
MKALLVLGFALQAMVGSWAAVAPDLAQDPVVEQRLISIAEELRCLVCQNESLAGSRADLANDLRREVRSLIKAGKSDDDIKQYLVERYGDFVLYRPPVKPVTWLLWFGPLLLLAGALWLLFGVVRRALHQQAPPALDAKQRAKARALLQDSD